MGASTVSSGCPTLHSSCSIVFKIQCLCGWPTITDGPDTATKLIARQMAQAQTPVRRARKHSRQIRASSKRSRTELVQHAHALLDWRQRVFGRNRPSTSHRIVDSMVITAIPGSSALKVPRFQCDIVTSQVAWSSSFSSGHPLTRLFDWANFSQVAPMGFSGMGPSGLHLFPRIIALNSVSTPAQEAKNPHRDLLSALRIDC